MNSGAFQHQHTYRARIRWTGNHGDGTRSYASYGRDHDIQAPGKPLLLASSDAAFRGDAARYNPEDLLLASLSSCHMLSYLHLAAQAGVIVTGYTDEAQGLMETHADGGRFVEVVLRPRVTIDAAGDTDQADALHHAAHHGCFIAASVNFPVHCEPRTVVESSSFSVPQDPQLP